MALGLALAMLAVVVAAAGLEGAVVRVYGGVVLTAAIALGAVAMARGPAQPWTRARAVGVALLGVTLLWQAAPIPRTLRAVVAPGQSAWIDRVAPFWEGQLDPWQAALATYDVEAALGLAGEWTYDVLAGAEHVRFYGGALQRGEWGWTLALGVAMWALYLAGRRVGRSEDAVRVVGVGMLLLGVAEALFGLANRGGGSTGIGDKLHYLGSATGTFVNRGHFGAFVVMAAACAWGLAAAEFPLLPEEARRHAKSRRRSSQPPSWFEAGGQRIPRLVLLGFLAALLTVALVASQSRGPLVALVVTGVGFGLWAWRRRDEAFHLGIGVALPVVGLVLATLAFGVRGAVGRFASIVSGGDVSVTSRVTVWKESLSAWLDAPVFGAGLGGWDTVWPLHEQGVHLFAFSHAHSEPVELLVELGVVGLAGLALLLVGWAREVVAGLRTAPHDPRTALGLGATVGVVAVAMQSLGDFPLRIPGVALPFAMLAGLAVGALSEQDEGVARPSTPRLLPALGLAFVGAALATQAAILDAGFTGSRDARVGEVARVWHESDRMSTLADARAVAERARAAATSAPLDPWVQAALARAEARIAETAWRLGGSRAAGDSPEDHAFAAERALARALKLRPRDPRIAVAVSKSLVRMARHSPTPDAFRERATRHLARAVGMDAWRAEEAFKTGRDLSGEALARVAAAAGKDARSRSRVAYEYGRELERRKQVDPALLAYREAADADPAFGPPAFAAGALLQARGDEAGATEMFEGFLAARDRPVGMEGWAHFWLGRTDAAEARFRQAVASAPANRWAWEGLVEVARRREDRRAELAALHKILDLVPGDEAVKARVRALEIGEPG